jgi:S-(hydroxymethyl)glutathione dehydrogenase/alcohol dehydrogenase
MSFMQEKAIIGSAYGSARPHADMPALVDLYMDGRLKLDELVTRTYALDEIDQAFADLTAGEVARGVLVMS